MVYLELHILLHVDLVCFLRVFCFIANGHINGCEGLEIKSGMHKIAYAYYEVPGIVLETIN
jgi:hypothetical protein